jgi:hypothetical protein
MSNKEYMRYQWLGNMAHGLMPLVISGMSHHPDPQLCPSKARRRGGQRTVLSVCVSPEIRVGADVVSMPSTPGDMRKLH